MLLTLENPNSADKSIGLRLIEEPIPGEATGIIPAHFRSLVGASGSLTALSTRARLSGIVRPHVRASRKSMHLNTKRRLRCCSSDCRGAVDTGPARGKVRASTHSSQREVKKVLLHFG